LSTLIHTFAHLLEGRTLTANIEHIIIIKFCPISLVKSDLKERKINMRHISEQKQRDTLELILREEEEWQQLVIMYRHITLSISSPKVSINKNEINDVFFNSFANHFCTKL
jgi:hypothetical protein